MNSTNLTDPNPEKEKILTIAGRICETGQCREIISSQTAKADSYYCESADLRLFNFKIFSYDFDTPAQLRDMLLRMWDYQQCGYMKEFAVPASIAVFHNKAEDKVETRVEIPSYIYNF